MGNQVSETKSPLENTKELISSKLGIKLSKKRSKQNDPFILELLSKNNKVNNQSIDQRRTVFVSLIGLFQTYQKCPSYILYTSLLIIPLKRAWIYEPNKYKNELQSHFILNLSFFYQDKNETTNLIKLIKWKDSQGFVLWALDDYDYDDDNKYDYDDDNKYDDCICNDNQLLIAPFWHYFSAKLASLYDGVTRNKYKSLKLKGKWWHNSFDNETFSKYDTKLTLILSELSFFGMKYKTMQEIIYQSNPKSLNPVIFYGESNVDFVNDISLLKCNDIDQDDDNQDLEKHGWYISTDYDPYDL